MIISLDFESCVLFVRNYNTTGYKINCDCKDTECGTKWKRKFRGNSHVLLNVRQWYRLCGTDTCTILYTIIRCLWEVEYSVENRKINDYFIYMQTITRSVIGIQGLELESVIFFSVTFWFRFRFLPTCTGRRIIAFRWKTVSDASLF